MTLGEFRNATRHLPTGTPIVLADEADAITAIVQNRVTGEYIIIVTDEEDLEGGED